jgi:hypothetical protein
MSFQTLSSSQFEAVLTDANVRQIQIIQAALGLGVFTFGIVIAVLYTTATAVPTREDIELIQMLTLGHLVILSGGAAMASILFRNFFSERQLAAAAKRTVRDSRGQTLTDPASKALAHVRSAIVLRLAVLEAPALFGLVICFLMVTNGAATVAPMYLLNALSAAGFIVYIATTFPNKDRLSGIFNEFVLKGS